MNVWIVTIGEPTLLDHKDSRLLRSEILCDKLVKKGNNVTFFNSTFHHVEKIHRYKKNTIIKYNDKLKYIFIKSLGYKKNISLTRLIDHIFIASKFKNLIKTLEKPDIILCSMPTIELAFQSVKYGNNNNIPVIIDIRDLWPDIFYLYQKSNLKKLIFRLIFSYSNFKLRNALSNCSSIIGITDPIVKWAESKTKTNNFIKNKSFFLTKHFNNNTDQNLEIAAEFWDNLGVVNSDFNISLCASFNSVIDFDTIINAASLLNNTNPNVKFILCGDGEKFDTIRKQTSEHKNIIVPGWINSSQIEILMLRSKFGLLPYRNTFDFKMSIPNKVSEYLSYGLPVLTCLKGSVEDLITEHKCGVVYIESDPIDLAKKVRNNVKYYYNNTFKKNAFILYKNKFEPNNIYENMYNHLMYINANYYK